MASVENQIPPHVFRPSGSLELQDDENIPECPVFRPNEQEFEDFAGYLEQCVSKIGDIGIFKVIPPKGWVARQSGYKKIKFDVKRPIEQNVQSTRVRGAYELILIDQMSRSLERFQTEAEKYCRITQSKTPNEVEKLFWKSLKNSSPIYGADVAGSLFDPGVPWNLAELKTILVKGLGEQKIPGVTNPYVYVGSWKTMFGWHKEDMDLYSINYLHHGSPKFWYGVDLRDNAKFEAFMHRVFPDNARRCEEFIRHKTTLVQPKVLAAEGIRLVKGYHLENEFMVQRAAAYHSGFNFGFNIAEAVNFALKDWLKIGSHVSFCRCIDYSVSIDMRKLLKNLELDPKDYGLPEAPEEEPQAIQPQTAPQPVRATRLARKLQADLGAPKAKLFKTEKVRTRINSDRIMGQDFSWFGSRDEATRQVHSQPVALKTKLEAVEYTNKKQKAPAAASRIEPAPKVGSKKGRVGKLLSKRSRPDHPEKLTSPAKKRVLRVAPTYISMNTSMQKTWYARTNDKSINTYEWIQIIDQLQPSLKVRQGKIREDLRKRLQQVKSVFYDLSKNNIKMNCFQTENGTFQSPEQYHTEVINLYRDMMSHQNIQVLSERLHAGNAKPDKKIARCCECHVDFELSAAVLTVIYKGRKEQTEAQALQISEALQGLKRIPNELKAYQNPQPGQKMKVKCYDLDERGSCWLKTHRELLARNEILKTYLKRPKRLQKRKLKEKQSTSTDVLRDITNAPPSTKPTESAQIDDSKGTECFSGNEDDIVRKVTLRLSQNDIKYGDLVQEMSKRKERKVKYVKMKRILEVHDS